MPQHVIRISDLASRPGKPGLLPVSPATIWRWVAQGKFPAPFKLGDNCTVWSAESVEAFISKQADAAQEVSA